MTREQIAANILYCGVKQGRDHVFEIFGNRLSGLLFTTFSELHKNNTPEEAFVFLILQLFNKRYSGIEADYEVNPDVTIDEILTYIQATPDFKREPRLTQLKPDQLKAVLSDFIYILSKQFFYQPEIFKSIRRN